MSFMRDNINRIIALDPRPEPLETPINDPVKTDNYYSWNITERGVDNTAE